MGQPFNVAPSNRRIHSPAPWPLAVERHQAANATTASPDFAVLAAATRRDDDVSPLTM
jgi:hypothetical protein